MVFVFAAKAQSRKDRKIMIAGHFLALMEAASFYCFLNVGYLQYF